MRCIRYVIQTLCYEHVAIQLDLLPSFPILVDSYDSRAGQPVGAQIANSPINPPHILHRFSALYKLRPLLIIFVLSLFAAAPALSQDTGGDVAVGAQLGTPSGVTLKFQNPDLSYEFLAAWDTGDFFFVNLHGLLQRPLDTEVPLYLFYGPGAYIGLQDQAGESDFVVGISGTVGLSYYFEQFEVYLRLTPRLDLLPDTGGDIGGGLGGRYYF